MYVKKLTHDPDYRNITFEMSDGQMFEGHLRINRRDRMSNFISIERYNNDKIFELCNIEKYSFCKRHGIKNSGGGWPETTYDDAIKLLHLLVKCSKAYGSGEF